MTGRAALAFDVKRQPGFGAVSVFCLVALYAPIALLILYSFNGNERVTLWTEFSWRWYAKALGNEEIRRAAVTSAIVGLTATVLAAAAATLAALATTRTRPFPGMNLAYGIISQPLMVPEIVTGIATLVFFAIIRQATGVQGLGYLIAAHTVFCIPFAYMPIRARLADMDLTLENAAADLYATSWQAFRFVTLPLLWPGIIAGAMLAFVVSLDDVVITVLVAGPGEETLPVYMINQIRRGVTPELNAMSTLFLGVSALLVTTVFLLTRKKP